MIPPLYAHQEETVNFLHDTPRAFIASSPGVGKTRSVLEYVQQNKQAGTPHKTLVLAPKTILFSSWGNDIRKYTGLTYAIADASHRHYISKMHQADLILVNHDGVKAIDPKDLDRFHTLVVDESTAYKHHTAQRSKAALAISRCFDNRIMMSGTPNPNGVMDLWHQYLLLGDEVTPLGTSYYRTRNILCEPVANGHFTRWIDRPGAGEAVADMIRPLTIRHRFEDVLDIPENFTYTLPIELSKDLQRHYNEFLRTTRLEYESGAVTATNAGAKLNKLMQIASGAVYNKYGGAEHICNQRAELAADLIEAREQCVVAYNWKHQSAALVRALDKKGISVGLINGDVPVSKRAEIVDQFQKHKLRVVLAHPAAAAHGLTLTAGTSTIWLSPSHHAEQFQQFNYRIYRAGQTRKTETIVILATGTVDEQVYKTLYLRLSGLETLLSILTKPLGDKSHERSAALNAA